MEKIIITNLCARSGKGTPMFSRRGRSTIAHYLCFRKNESKKLKPYVFDTFLNKKVEKKKATKVDELTNLVTLLENRKKEIISLHQNSLKNITPIKQNAKKRVVLIKRKDKPSVPPLGHYRPTYDFIKPRVSSYCFHKSGSRKSIFDGVTPKSKGKRKVFVSKQLSTTHNSNRKNARPQTSLAKRSNYNSNMGSPGRSQIHLASFHYDVDPNSEYLFSENVAKNKKSSKRCRSASKHTSASTRVGTSNTTYTNINVDQSVMSSWM